MKLTRATLLASVGLILVAELAPEMAMAQQWFRCANGYTLERQGHRARCFRAGERVRIQPDVGCPSGSTFQQDHSGNVDYCAPVGGALVGKPFSAKCASNQIVEKVSGRDRCLQRSEPSIRPVDVAE
jgi:hypothetical protein